MKYLLTIIAITFCSASFGQLINGGMETWRTYTAGSETGLQAPDGWFGTDSLNFALGPLGCSSCSFQVQTFQCDTPHSGSYAAKIMTRNMGGTIGVEGAVLTNSTIEVNLSTGASSIHGGTPVTQRIDSITFWVKYFPRGGDSGSAAVQPVLAGLGAGGTDSVVGSSLDPATTGWDNYILTTPVYTRHTYVMSYYPPTVVPDHIQILFASYITQATDSSVMDIDDVTMYMSGLAVPLFSKHDVLCYPNPASDVINIQTNQYENAVAILYNVLGQQVATQNLQGYKTEMNIGNLSDGIYILHLTNAANEIIYRNRIVKQ